MHLPEELKDYFVFATVRNPYEHLLSLYKFFNKGAPKGKISNEDFKNELDKLLKRKSICEELHQSEEYNPPINFVKYKLDAIVKLENLEEDFHKLPFMREKIKIPWIGKSKENDIKYTWNMIRKVLIGRRNDFDLFNYPYNPPEHLM